MVRKEVHARVGTGEEAPGAERRGERELAFKGMEFQFGKMKKSWASIVVTVAHQCECTKCH